MTVQRPPSTNPGKDLEEAYARIDRALLLVRRYGMTEGTHHKVWLIDQVTRALTGCQKDGVSEEYVEFITKTQEDDEWDTGTPP